MKFILEAYEGLSTMSTVDGKRGIVRVNYPLSCAGDIAALMAALAKEIAVTEVTEAKGGMFEAIDTNALPG
jgi:hypothetical protein